MSWYGAGLQGCVFMAFGRLWRAIIMPLAAFGLT
jgi:hypothetical protein